MDEKGLKYDGEKPRMDLLSTEALRRIAEVLTFGAKKYDPNNWRKGIEWSRVIAAAMRHLTAFNAGEDFDPESGLSHLSHLGCCVMFLLEFQKTHPEMDDRYKKEGLCQHERGSIYNMSDSSFVCCTCKVVVSILK